MLLLESISVAVSHFDQFSHSFVGRTWLLRGIAGNVVFNVSWDNVSFFAEEFWRAPDNWLWLCLSFSNRLIDHHNFTGPDSKDLHLILGKSSGLVRANVISTTHDFTRGKTLHIVVVLQHALNGVGK